MPITGNGSSGIVPESWLWAVRCIEPIWGLTVEFGVRHVGQAYVAVSGLYRLAPLLYGHEVGEGGCRVRSGCRIVRWQWFG